jgi:hypothetical protein
MGTISRGFSGRRSAVDVKLSPGQYLTNDFPASWTCLTISNSTTRDRLT